MILIKITIKKPPHKEGQNIRQRLCTDSRLSTTTDRTVKSDCDNETMSLTQYINKKEKAFQEGKIMLKKISSLTGTAALVLTALSCMQTAEAAGKFAWQKDVVCKRSTVATPINITTENMSSSVNNGKGCFNGPNKNCNIRMYQIMVESYIHGEGGAMGYGYAWGPSQHDGNLKGIIENLNYIKSTGANAILLTPIFKTEIAQNQDNELYKLDGTGYFTSNYFQVDPKFGTMEELKDLVNKAHALGMRVIFDAAFGHSKINVNPISPSGHRLVLDKQCRDITGNPDHMILTYGTCFNTAQSIDFLKEIATYWVKEAKIDGWRLDQTFQIKPEQWEEIRKAMEQESAKPANAYKLGNQTVQPAAFMMAQMFSYNLKDYQNVAFVNNSLESAIGLPVRNSMIRVFATKESYSNGDCSKPASMLNEDTMKLDTLEQHASMVSYISNHELVRFGDLLQRAGYEQDGHKGDSYYNAHRAVISYMTAMSGPMILFYGDEFGEDMPNFSKQPATKCYEINQCDDHVSRTQARTSGFTSQEQALRKDVAEYLNLRDTHKSLSSGSRHHIYSDESAYIDLKQYQNDRVLYVLNYGDSTREITIASGVWQKLGLGSCNLTKLVGQGDVSTGVIKAPALSGTFFGLNCR